MDVSEQSFSSVGEGFFEVGVGVGAEEAGVCVGVADGFAVRVETSWPQMKHVFGQAICTSPLSQWLETLFRFLRSQLHPFDLFRIENIIDVSIHPTDDVVWLGEGPAEGEELGFSIGLDEGFADG